MSNPNPKHPHVPTRKFTRRIHTRGGVNIATYTFVECELCGPLAFHQDLHGRAGLEAFDVSEEIVDSKRHFRFFEVGSMPVSEEQSVCVDPEPLTPWTADGIEEMLRKPMPKTPPRDGIYKPFFRENGEECVRYSATGERAHRHSTAGLSPGAKRNVGIGYKGQALGGEVALWAEDLDELLGDDD